ncbi:MAG: hypothetical protein JW841_11795 [Deltaproteobacteria bacterium]|nr:hypothetical protein [Deltaproteobacteria bacterium]
MQRIQPNGWQVTNGTTWIGIRKFKFGKQRRAKHGDEHNIAALALHAFEAKCDILAFIRDTDSNHKREGDINNGIEIAAKKYVDLKIIGGVAKPKLEAWLLALTGQNGTEQLSLKQAEDKLGCDKNTDCMVTIVKQANLDAIPKDAHSLFKWCNKVKQALIN